MNEKSERNEHVREREGVGEGMSEGGTWEVFTDKGHSVKAS